MISQVKKQDIDLWEVWIEYDQFNQKKFGTLYVLGEIHTDGNTTSPALEKSVRSKNQQLVLQVPERPKGRCRMKEVYYSEPIAGLGQYTSIAIFAGQELVASFDDIEVMI